MSTGGIAKFLGPEMGLKWAASRDGGLESPKQIAVANLRGHIRVQLRFALPSKSHPTPPANDQVRMIIGLLRTELAAMSIAKKDIDFYRHPCTPETLSQSMMALSSHLPSS